VKLFMLMYAVNSVSENEVNKAFVKGLCITCISYILETFFICKLKGDSGKSHVGSG